MLPLFHDRGPGGIPYSWLARAKTSMSRLIPRFSADHMLRDYITELYAPPGAGKDSGG